MIDWGSIVVLVSSALPSFGSDPSLILLSVAELAGVIALFTLICATEASN